MVFNSLCFVPFLLAAVAVQRWVESWRLRKGALIAFSYAFYAAWYPSAIVLLWASTLFDFHVARAIERSVSESRRRTLLVGSTLLNMGVLFMFKYLGFVGDNTVRLLNALGLHVHWQRPHWALPVGISFFTFMSLSYVTDVYRKRREAERSLLDFALFLSFFPHLVAGPIVRGDDFLPQCKRPRRPTLPGITWGVLLLVIGLFQKVVVADAWMGPLADRVFGAAIGQYSMRDAWLGTLAFSAQIYCDFAGYSTCALGAAACLGFVLPENFQSPYVAIGFSDFWRRWHITLSSWLRDYVYVGLGGNRAGPAKTLRNLMLTMLLGGLWHGASWTFVIWGGLHGIFLCIERLLKQLATATRWSVAAWLKPLLGGGTFLAVTWAWVFFRAPNLAVALDITRALAHVGHHTHASLIGGADVAIVGLGTSGIILGQWLTNRHRLDEWADQLPNWAVASLAACALLAVIIMAGEDRAFIYFQF